MAAACVREPAADSDDEPLSGELKAPRGRWAWNGPAQVPASQVLPTDASRLSSAARALSPSRVAPLPAPLPLAAEEPEEPEDAPGALFDGWNALPAELLELVYRRLDTLLVEWPERSALLAACGVCRAWRRVGRQVLAPRAWSEHPSSDFVSPERLLVPVRRSLRSGRAAADAATKGPRVAPLRCIIKRVKGSLKRRYLLFLDRGDGPGKFLLAACSTPGAICSVYDISTCRSGDGALGAVVAQLRSNFLGTQYHIIQSDAATASCAASLTPEGDALAEPWSPESEESLLVNPLSSGVSHEGDSVCLEDVLGAEDDESDEMLDASIVLGDALAAQQLGHAAAPSSPSAAPGGSTVVGALSYDPNLLAQRGPRRMAVALSNPLLPVLPHAEEAADADAGGEEEGKGFALLRNKAPKWQEEFRCWCLDFGGRVTTASVKNFQLVGSQEGAVVMQFGRTSDTDTFVMDYQWPLSAVQAFAVALSAFDTKLACR